MSTDPYRDPGTRDEERSPVAGSSLGSMRSEHNLVPFKTAMRVPVLAAGAGLAIGVVMSKGQPLSLLAGALVIAGFVAWGYLRQRRLKDLRVMLHQGGVVVERGGVREVVLYDDVDELWLIGKRYQGLLIVTSVRMTRHGGSDVIVPITVSEPNDLLSELNRRSSSRLIPEALAAARAGQALTFSGVTVTREGIRVGDDWATFEDLSLIRFQSGRIILHRRTTLVAWHQIDHTCVPHPFVLVALISALTPKTMTEQ